MATSAEVQQFLHDIKDLESRLQSLYVLRNQVFNHHNYHLGLVEKYTSSDEIVIHNQDYSPPQEVWDLLDSSIKEKAEELNAKIKEMESKVRFE
jgi:hypothetical protein